MIDETIAIPRRLVPDATIDLILHHIASGNHVRGSCEAAGVSKSSFYAWLVDDHELAEKYGEALRMQTRARYVK
ncbi:terminase small subunit-like protein [Caballeronia sp. KNU42]